MTGDMAVRRLGTQSARRLNDKLNGAYAENEYFIGKCDYAHSGKEDHAAYIAWSLKDGRFSMSADIRNPYGTDIVMGGQCVDTVAAFFPNDKKARRMVEIWRRWHMNDMRAGCEHQRAEGWDKRPIDPNRPPSTYITLKRGECGLLRDYSGWNMLAWATLQDHPNGLLSEPCAKCGYKYGTSWLCEELPADVVAEIESWSETAGGSANG